MLKRVPVLLFLLATMIISTLSLNAATTYNVPTDYTTIQEAIDACNGGDEYIIEVEGKDFGEYYEENLVIPANLNFSSLTIIGIGDFIHDELSPYTPKVDPDDPTPQYGYSSRIHGLEGDEPTIAIYHSNVTIKNLRILNLKRTSEDPFSENDKRNVLIYIAPGLENVVITQNNIGPQTGDGTVVNIYYDISYEEEDKDPVVYTGGTHGIFIDGKGSGIVITENEINGISGLGDAIRFEADENGFDDCTIQYNYIYNLRMSHLVVLGKITNSLIGNNVYNDAGFYELKFPNLVSASSVGEGAFGNGIVLLNNSSSNMSNINILGNSIAGNLHTGLYIYGGVDNIYVNGNDFYLNMDAITLNGDNEEPFFPGDPDEIEDNNSFSEVLLYRNVIYANTRFGIFNNTDYPLCAQENYFEEPSPNFQLGGFGTSNGPQYAWGEFDHTLYYFDGENFDGGRTFYNSSASYKPADDDENVVPGASMIYGKIDFSPYIYDLSDYSTRNITVDNNNTTSEFDNIANAMLAVHSVCDRDIVEVVATDDNYSEQFTIYNPVELKGKNGIPIIDPENGPIITSVSAGDSKITGFQFNIPSSGGLGLITNNTNYKGNVYMVGNTYFNEDNEELTSYTGTNGVDQYITDDMDYSSDPTRGSGVVGQFVFDFPVALAKNIKVEIGSGGTNGKVTVLPSQINNGSFDFECLITNSCSSDLIFTILYDSDNNGTPEEYDATNGLTLTTIGTYTVKLKVCDQDGNCDISENVTITVEDNTPPNAIAKDITVQTGPTGTVTIDPEDLDNGSTDNSGGPLTFIILYDSDNNGTTEEYEDGELSFSVPGEYNVQLKVCDESGNCSTDDATITVEDNTPPNAIAKDITVQTGSTGTVTIDPEDLDNGSTDNSGGPLTFIILYDSDNDGVYEEFTSLSLPIGTYTVKLKVCDLAENCDESDEVTITVNDGTLPTVVTKNITVYLNQNGTVTIDPKDLNGGSTDNSCGTANDCANSLTFSASPTTFTATGNYNVTLTVTDPSGNSATGTATVFVKAYSQILRCPNNITAYTGSSATTCSTRVTWTAPRSNDRNIVITSTHSSGSTFPVGTTTVTYTARNRNTNEVLATCSFDVTVIDNTKPIASCKSITVELDANGSASISANQINNGSSDNCGIKTMSVSPSTFTCNDVYTGSYNMAPSEDKSGDQTLCYDGKRVILTVEDYSGNKSTCTTYVKVVDKIKPTAICKSGVEVELNSNGCATLSASAIDGGSYDNCSIVSRTVSPSSFNKYDVGNKTVVLTVKDKSGNTSTCTTTVKVVDKIKPVLTVSLSKNCLWPPNHKLVEITATVNVSDNVTSSSNIDWWLESITSNEPDNSQQCDGNTVNDIQEASFGTKDTRFKLRAERCGNGNGRIYTIVYKAKDAAGNVTTITKEVCVKHDQSRDSEEEFAGFDIMRNIQGVYPNPFTDQTNINFYVPADGTVRIDIVNSIGQTVRTLVNGFKQEGYYEIIFDGKDNSGLILGSGIYYCKISNGTTSESIPVVIVR